MYHVAEGKLWGDQGRVRVYEGSNHGSRLGLLAGAMHTGDVEAY